MPFRPKPLNIGIDGIIIYKVFLDETDRDAYFTINPQDLLNDMYIYLAASAKFQKFTKPADVWVDMHITEGYWIFVK